MRLSILILFTAFLSYASSAQTIITLEDGREILLNDDFTWQYSTVEKATVKPNDIEVLTPVATIPAKKNTPMTTILLESNENTMQLSDGGIDLLLGKATYEEDKLVIPVTVTNQSASSVTAIYVAYQMFDVGGNLLSNGDQAVWLSINRLADTYLRPQTSKQGKPLVVYLPNLEKYQITAKITEVKFR